MHLTNEETQIVLSALVSRPWLEVNELIVKLTAAPQPVAKPWDDTPTVAAPYGLKKDGTPRARPGRKPSKRKAK